MSVSLSFEPSTTPLLISDGIIPLGNRGECPMAPQTVDFQQVKQAATVEHVIRYFGLTLKQTGDTWRGSCHLCKASDQRAFVITTSKRLFHCFKCKEGGDMLKLVAVSKGVPIRDAAINLAGFCGVELVVWTAPGGIDCARMRSL